MELSWSYQDTMRRVTSISALRRSDSVWGNYYPAALHFDLNKSGCEIPIYCAMSVESILNKCSDEGCEVVIPMCVDSFSKNCSGAETIIKHFVRFYACDSRLAMAKTPKGEVYYGASGIILDKDFNPLMLTTTSFIGYAECFPGASLTPQYDGITVHLHPNVFLDDTSVINKSLAKKGMQFFLSSNISGYGNRGAVKVVIDDCSKFIRRVEKPDVNNLGPEVFNQVLKDNIDEVLGQFIADNSRN